MRNWLINLPTGMQQDHLGLGTEPYIFETEIEPNCHKANNEDELMLATVSATNISTISTDSHLGNGHRAPLCTPWKS